MTETKLDPALLKDEQHQREVRAYTGALLIGCASLCFIVTQVTGCAMETEPVPDDDYARGRVDGIEWMVNKLDLDAEDFND